ncbi:MAG: DUF5305 domain-containing protein [Oscillospiraceae bacterium]|nr:DUF5305 domain-containing protein [Oscillospiraceae bacterium]
MRILQNIKTYTSAILIFCTVCLAITMVFIAVFAFKQAADTAVNASAKNDVRFTVHYQDNKIFGAGPRPPELHYLMSYTDFIAIENSFSADFDQKFDVAYQYTAKETLLIKYLKTSDTYTNPAVFEEKVILSEVSGTVSGKNILFTGKEAGDKPGGEYITYPKKYIDTYRKFVLDQKAQMEKEDVTTDRALSFSAELLVEFIYKVNIKDNGINETINRALTIPLSNEVYMISDDGKPIYDLSVAGSEKDSVGVLTVILIALWISVNVYGIIYGLRQKEAKKDEYKFKVDEILRKYADEITISLEPTDLTGQQFIYVPEFKELLKLAINLNKHILCYATQDLAEFYVFAEGYVYCYKLARDADDVVVISEKSGKAKSMSEWDR